MNDFPRTPRWTVPAFAALYLITAILLVEASRAFQLNRALQACLVVFFAVGVYGFTSWSVRRIQASHRALEDSEQRYAAFVRNSSEGIWRIELRRPLPLELPIEQQLDHFFEHGYYAEVNDAFLAMYGPGAEALVGSDLSLSLPRDENEDMIRFFLENDLRIQDALSTEIAPDGSVLYIKSNCLGIEESGHLLRVWGNQVDVTEQRRAEEELEHKSRLLSGAERVARIGGWTYDPAAERFDWSDNLYLIGGADRESFDPSLENVVAIMHRDDRDRWTRALQHTVETGVLFQQELRVFRRGGSLIYLETRGEPIFDNSGKVVSVLGFSRDITREKQAELERRNLEAQVRQLQKAEAVGTLASSMAHDFNNILAATMGHTDVALGDLDPGHPAYPCLREIEKANLRAKDLVDQILKHSRHFDERREPVRPAAVVREALGLLQASLPASIRLVAELDGIDAWIEGDASQLHQVVINLCTNACHAMPDGGTLRLRLEKVHGPRSLTVGELGQGPAVCLTVADDGHGIPAELRDRIFDPFFTTKAPGKGTGLGLSTVKGIVVDHQGGIHLRCPEEGGTCFELFFPICEAPTSRRQEDGSPAVGSVEPSPGEEERRPTVLLVDDEETLISLGRRMLDRLGYHAVAFTSAPAALEHVRRSPETFDLVVTDLRMPEMSGLDMAREIRKIRPESPILVTTGFSDVDLDAHLEEGLIQGYLLKPFNLDDMRRSLVGVPTAPASADRGGTLPESRVYGESPEGSSAS